MKKGKILIWVLALLVVITFPKNVFAMDDSSLQCTEETIVPIEDEEAEADTVETEEITEMETVIEDEIVSADIESEETVNEEVVEVEVNTQDNVYDKAEDIYTNRDVYDFIVRMYDKFLNRSADPEGLDVWYNKLVNHEMDAADIVDGFISSQEFQGKNLDTKDYLDILYEGMLGRKADSTGIETWSQILKEGVSRKYVLAQFVNSQEFIRLCDTYKVNKGNITLAENRDQNYDVTRFVSYFYNYCLERSGDVKGLNDWTGWLLNKSMTGSDIAQGFLLSKEFIEKGLSDKEFIEILYRTILSRASDAEGMTTWIEHLENGVSNSYILSGFAHSKEFSALCESYGIVRGEVVLTENRDKNYELTSLMTQLYKECLGYKPEGEELNNKIGQLFNKELSCLDMVIAFFDSSFYQTKNKDAEAFIADVYNLVLRRQPSEEEISIGVEHVTAASRETAINRILLMKEFSEKCDNYNIELLNYSSNPAMWYAKEILDQVGWDMVAAFRWSHTALTYSGVETPPAGTSHTQWYGKYGYENRKGNCYVMAAVFYWMAKVSGWEVYLVEGYVPLARGGMGPHGWVEVVQNGTTYICDPDFAYESGRNGYFITYGTSGTWRYSSYHRVN